MALDRGLTAATGFRRDPRAVCDLYVCRSPVRAPAFHWHTLRATQCWKSAVYNQMSTCVLSRLVFCQYESKHTWVSDAPIVLVFEYYFGSTFSDKPSTLAHTLHQLKCFDIILSSAFFCFRSTIQICLETLDQTYLRWRTRNWGKRLG
jgi:hypothetical protein